MEQVDNLDLEKLYEFQRERDKRRKEWEEVKNKMSEHKMELIKLTTRKEVLEGLLDDAEEDIRVQKLTINIKPK